MNKFKTLIVVEGKTDIDFLSSFIDADFYSVNGSAVSQKDISFIKEYKKKGEVIVLTDPDYPGTKIRNFINENTPDLKNAYVKKELSIKRNKVGVAESTIDEVKRAINSAISFKIEKSTNNTLKTEDLSELGLVGKENSKELRNFVSEKFNLGYNNGKSLLKKLNMLGIEKNEIKEALKDVK